MLNLFSTKKTALFAVFIVTLKIGVKPFIKRSRTLYFADI
jgi:hypothetical protein